MILFDWSWLAGWQNAFLLWLDLCLVALFGLYVHRRVREQFRKLGWAALWWRAPSTDGAIALSAYFASMVWVRGVLWLARFDRVSLTAAAVLVSMGLAGAVFSLACLLRVFSNVPWGAWTWVWCIGASLLLSWLMMAQ